MTWIIHVPGVRSRVETTSVCLLHSPAKIFNLIQTWAAGGAQTSVSGASWRWHRTRSKNRQQMRRWQITMDLEFMRPHRSQSRLVSNYTAQHGAAHTHTCFVLSSSRVFVRCCVCMCGRHLNTVYSRLCSRSHRVVRGAPSSPVNSQEITLLVLARSQHLLGRHVNA